MRNTMVKYENKNGTGYVSLPTNEVDQFLNAISAYIISATKYSAGEMPFEALPEDVQVEVKDILKAFPEVTVDYSNGRFEVFAGIFISAWYADDHIACGTYKDSDVFNEEERRQNFIESFGYDPHW